MKNPINNLLSYVTSFVAFFISMYLISLFKYVSWVRDIITYGVPEKYNLLIELFYVIPYFGPSITILNLVAINLFALSVGVLVYYISDRNIHLRNFVRRNIIPITLTILAGVTVSIGLSLNNCILNIDYVMASQFSNIIERHTNLVSNQLQIIGCVLSTISLTYIYDSNKDSKNNIFQ